MNTKDLKIWKTLRMILKILKKGNQSIKNLNMMMSLKNLKALIMIIKQMK